MIPYFHFFLSYYQTTVAFTCIQFIKNTKMFLSSCRISILNDFVTIVKLNPYVNVNMINMQIDDCDRLAV